MDELLRKIQSKEDLTTRDRDFGVASLNSVGMPPLHAIIYESGRRVGPIDYIPRMVNEDALKAYRVLKAVEEAPKTESGGKNYAEYYADFIETSKLIPSQPRRKLTPEEKLECVKTITSKLESIEPFMVAFRANEEPRVIAEREERLKQTEIKSRSSSIIYQKEQLELDKKLLEDLDKSKPASAGKDIMEAYHRMNSWLKFEATQAGLEEIELDGLKNAMSFSAVGDERKEAGLDYIKELETKIGAETFDKDTRDKILTSIGDFITLDTGTRFQKAYSDYKNGKTNPPDHTPGIAAGAGMAAGAGVGSNLRDTLGSRGGGGASGAAISHAARVAERGSGAAAPGRG